MPRYVAFLRGVSPVNAKMPELKRCFEQAGFRGVRTLLASGNVVFDARAATEATLERRAEAAMQAGLGRSFGTIVRTSAFLRALIDADHYSDFELTPACKRVVTFLRRDAGPHAALPIEFGEARILCRVGREVYTTYVPNRDDGPGFMRLIEKTFGTDLTTRTWDTVRKCAEA